MRGNMHQDTDSSSSESGTTRALILFVTGDAPRSRRARSHLSAALADTRDSSIPLEEIDLIAHPSAAVQYRVFATPALVWSVAGEVRSVIYGDLSDPEALQEFLAQEG